MKNVPHSLRAGSTIHRFNPFNVSRIRPLLRSAIQSSKFKVQSSMFILLAVTLLTLPTLHAQLAAPEPGVGGTLPAPGVFQPFVDGLLGHYGWLTTVLLAIGSLRILFKPIMLVVENALKNDPAKFAKVQAFEAGPVYKTIATVLDVGASIKLPLVRPPVGKP